MSAHLVLVLLVVVRVSYPAVQPCFHGALDTRPMMPHEVENFFSLGYYTVPGYQVVPNKNQEILVCLTGQYHTTAFHHEQTGSYREDFLLEVISCPSQTDVFVVHSEKQVELSAVAATSVKTHLLLEVLTAVLVASSEIKTPNSFFCKQTFKLITSFKV